MPAAAHLRRLRDALGGGLTFGELVDRLGRDGSALLVLLLSLPFLQPIPLAGLGTPVGVFLIAVGVQLALGHEAPVLPDFVKRRRLEASTVERLLSAAERVLAFVERFARPRARILARSPKVLGAAIAVVGAIFAVPIFVPFGNPISAFPLACLGIALLEEDGVFAGLGVAGVAVTVVYHAAFIYFVWHSGASLFGGKA